MYTINKKGHSEYTEKRSKFLGFCHHLDSTEQYKELINHYRSIYSDSSHVCGAYRLMKTNQIIDFQSDDGEPKGTAGVPLLNSLKKEKLINSAVVVIRYYGGTNLGVPGLIHAYATTAQDTIYSSKKIKWKVEKEIELIYAYSLNKSIEFIIKKFKGSVKSQSFDHEIKSKVLIDSELVRVFQEELIQRTSNQIIIKL
mgnify:CR=1 FL=1